VTLTIEQTSRNKAYHILEIANLYDDYYNLIEIFWKEDDWENSFIFIKKFAGIGFNINNLEILLESYFSRHLDKIYQLVLADNGNILLSYTNNFGIYHGICNMLSKGSKYAQEIINQTILFDKDLYWLTPPDEINNAVKLITTIYEKTSIRGSYWETALECCNNDYDLLYERLNDDIETFNNEVLNYNEFLSIWKSFIADNYEQEDYLKDVFQVGKQKWYIIIDEIDLIIEYGISPKYIKIAIDFCCNGDKKTFFNLVHNKDVMMKKFIRIYERYYDNKFIKKIDLSNKHMEVKLSINEPKRIIDFSHDNDDLY
jgi:hypothetical protein